MSGKQFCFLVINLQAQQFKMSSIEIKEIFSTQLADYKNFLAAGLEHDADTLLITARDNWNAPFPTKDSNDSFTLGAYADQVLAGVASFARDGADREKLRHKGMLFTMYVKKEFRGQGIAGQLLGAIIERVKAIPGIEQVNLVVLSDNVHAKKLYAKFGFEKYGTELHSSKWKDAYSDEDLMVLRL